MREVHLHIDRITVEGLSATEQRRFARVLEAQLHAFAEGGGADAIAGGGDRTIRTLNAGKLAPRASASGAAAQVVKTLRQSLPGRAGSGATVRGGEAHKNG